MQLAERLVVAAIAPIVQGSSACPADSRSSFRSLGLAASVPVAVAAFGGAAWLVVDSQQPLRKHVSLWTYNAAPALLLNRLNVEPTYLLQIAVVVGLPFVAENSYGSEPVH